MSKTQHFHESIQNAFNAFIADQKKLTEKHDYIKIDLHCHDHNSDVPDELLGRILNVPETWLKTKKLLQFLKKQEMDLVTITNHNNARSCFELKSKGNDVLVGAEFTCTIPDFQVSIHTLAYGFTQEQESELNHLRKNLYEFLNYCKTNRIPTIWAHPLYFYSPGGVPPIEFFEKMLLVFERFEVINGQRDTWQNILFKTWLEQFDKEKIDTLATKYDIDINRYCHHPYKKSYFAGSDSHMGLFAGSTGTYLLINQWKEQSKLTPLSELALEAIWNGDSAVFGTHQSNEKLMIAFLDYFLQLAKYKEDPGMLRLLFHKGTSRDKLLAYFVSNAINELRYHKMTMRFINVFQHSFQGKESRPIIDYVFNKSYRKILNESRLIAREVNEPSENQLKNIYHTIENVYQQLLQLFFKRIHEKLDLLKQVNAYKKIDPAKLFQSLDFPVDIRNYKGSFKRKTMHSEYNFNIFKVLDGLPFPFLASQLILAAKFASAKVLYNNRELLNQFANSLQDFQHPKRILWLSDTWQDKNGVAQVLQTIHQEIKTRNLPIDFLVCSNEVEPDSNLFVLKPQLEFSSEYYPQQPIRIPDLSQIHDLFIQGEYDQVICSTEGFMGLAAIYLKNAFTVKASFFMHTDWIQFASESEKFGQENLEKLRRILREFYHQFDQIFVLNQEHQNWLLSKEMEIKPVNVKLTAHWADDIFYPRPSRKSELFGINPGTPVILFSGRLSKEKGVMDIVDISNLLRERFPEIQFVFAGNGPQEKKLKSLMPDALFMGWMDHKALPEIYSSADLLILPSRFDTFSLVVLEAMSCGLPVAAYQSKGPKEIISSSSNGILATDPESMVHQITLFFQNEDIKETMRTNAINRAQNFTKNNILLQFLKDLGHPTSQPDSDS